MFLLNTLDKQSDYDAFIRESYLVPGTSFFLQTTSISVKRSYSVGDAQRLSNPANQILEKAGALQMGIVLTNDQDESCLKQEIDTITGSFVTDVDTSSISIEFQVP